MKKLILCMATALLLSVSSVEAANYNYSNHDQFVANYQRKHSEDFKKFSIGADYVLSKLDFADKTMNIQNPLYDSDDEIYTVRADNFDDSLDSMSVNIGFRPWRYFGIEAFYQQALSSKGVTGQEHYAGRDRFGLTEYEMDYKAYGIDAVFYIPLAQQLELIATAGYAQYSFDATFNINAYQVSSEDFVKGNSADFSEDIGSFRAGIGLQLKLTERLAFRAMYRYVPLGGDFVDLLNEFTLGVRYSF